jgi:hypothetical protein
MGKLVLNHGVLWKGDGEMQRKWAEVENLPGRDPGGLVNCEVWWTPS